MTKPPVIDAHAHILAEDTIKLLAKETPKIAPKLTPIDKDNFELTIAGTPYRPFPRGGFDLEQRFADMKASEVDMQVLSNTPQTFLYNQDAELTAATSRRSERPDRQARRGRPDRFMGIATLPMQAPQARRRRAHARHAQARPQGRADRLQHQRQEPRRPEPRAVLGGRECSSRAFIMVHPTQVAGADRLKTYYLANLIGNPLDTTIATACLVFGGVIAAPSQDQVLHGARRRLRALSGGALAARLARARGAEGESQGAARGRDQRLYFDTILHGQPALEFLVATFGAAHVLLGSDYPYDMGTLECARQVRRCRSRTPTARRSWRAARAVRRRKGTRAAS